MKTETAFDAVACGYDRSFTGTPLGQMLRRRVWQKLALTFSAGQELLELACGTGEDAVWLAQRGVRVTATDASPQMLAVAERKARAASLSARITLQTLSLHQVAAGQASLTPLCGPYDGVFSNFGGLNNTPEWQPLAEVLGQMVRRGGAVVLVVMGPFCPWEIGWHLLHGEGRRAFRRFGRATTATVGGTTVPVWYPSPRRLQRDFAPWFRHLETESLGLWLPPSYLGHLVARWPRPFSWLDRFERASAGWFGGWGDHYIAVFERR